MGLTDEQHQRIKALSANKELMDEMEKTDPHIRTRMAGMLLSRWIPVGGARKTLAAAFLIAGGLGLYYSGNLWYLLCFVIAASFSPRIVGNLFIMMGYFKQGMDEARAESNAAQKK